MQPEALLPSLYHGYKSLQHIIDTLKKRFVIRMFPIYAILLTLY